jgi:hypothetical protein
MTNKIMPVRFTPKELQNHLLDWREEMFKDLEHGQKRNETFLKDLIQHCGNFGDLGQILYPYFPQKFIENHYKDKENYAKMLEDSYKERLVDAPIAKAYLDNIRNLGRLYVQSATDMIKAVGNLEYDEKDVEHLAGWYYEDLEGLAYYPPIVETLENITSMEHFEDICDHVDEKRNQTIMRANMFFEPRK